MPDAGSLIDRVLAWLPLGLLALASLAVTVAAQDTLADVVDGILILLDRPFRVGHRIQIQELKTWGDVTHIGLRTTRIRTLDNRLVVVPNSKIGRGQVVNYTYPDRRYRLEVFLGIAQGPDVEPAREIMIRAVRSAEGVMADRPVEALLDALEDGAVRFRIRCWIDSYTDFRRIRDRVLTGLYAALQEAGIQAPTTTYDVRLHDPRYESVFAREGTT